MLSLDLGCYRYGRIMGNIPHSHTCLPCCLSYTRFDIDNKIFSIPLSFCPLWPPPLILIFWTFFPSNVFSFYLFLSIIFLFSSKNLIDWEHFFYFLGHPFFLIMMAQFFSSSYWQYHFFSSSFPFDYRIKKIKFLWFKMISNLIFNF